jgi:phosphoribosyl-AMP cyclohydrolase / phosphoribosyl-ATP pyrophosphohydrolase
VTANLDDVVFGADGLTPIVVQDAATKEVLMLAYGDREAVRRTIESNTTWFWSRSRGEYWNKGATSGNVQEVVEIRVDCDGDALLVLVDPKGPACHTGENSCFFRSLPSSR